MLDLKEISRIEKTGCPGKKGNWVNGEAALLRSVHMQRLQNATTEIYRFANVNPATPISDFSTRNLEIGRKFIEELLK